MDALKFLENGFGVLNIMPPFALMTSSKKLEMTMTMMTKKIRILVICADYTCNFLTNFLKVNQI